MLKAHGRDEVLQFGIDFAAGLLFPGIKRALEMAGVKGHHQIRAQRETVGLSAEFFLTFPPGRPRASVANLSLQLMRSFVVVQVSQLFASIVRVRIGAQQVIRSEQQAA